MTNYQIKGLETDLNELKTGVENQSSVTNVSTGISTRAAEQVPSNEFMKVIQDELSQLIEISLLSNLKRL